MPSNLTAVFSLLAFPRNELLKILELKNPPVELTGQDPLGEVAVKSQVLFETSAAWRVQLA